MSRSGYTDDGENVGLWRAAVDRAIAGKRGQAFLVEALAALDAMPVKELAADSLQTEDGEFCTLGAVGAARGKDMTTVDPDDQDSVADFFGIARAMACEIVYENDEQGWRYEQFAGPPRRWQGHSSYRVEETPAERWTRMRAWVASKIKGAAP